jgi:PAS domain S-box-containing protein
MNLASIPVVVMGSISLYVGCYHLLNYLRQRKHPEDLTFGLLCLSMTLYAAISAGLYSCDTVAEGAEWQRAQFMALAVFTIAFLWFATIYTHQKPTIITYAITTIFVILIIIHAIEQSGLSLRIDHPLIKSVYLPLLKVTIKYYEVELGLFSTLQTFLGLFVSIYIMFLILRYHERGNKREAMPLLVAMAFVFIAAASDSAVAIGLYSFIYLIEYGYTAVILLMAFSLSSTVVKATMIKDALYESEERFRALVETTSDWVWEVDENCEYTYTSPKCRELLGYEPAELVGKTPFDLMPPQDDKQIKTEFRRILLSHKPIESFENTAVHKNGHLVILETSGVPVYEENGTFTGYRGIDRDITYRKAAEDEKNKLQEQLQQAMKMEAVGRLAGGIAHDFNNLLTAIIGNIDLAKLSLDSPDSLSKCLEGIGVASESAASLTRQLLAFSRRQIIEPRVLILNTLVTNLQRMLSRLLGEDVILDTILSEKLGCVKVDPGQFEQVLVNLAVNARDAMPGGGKLLIETSNIDFDEEFHAHHTILHPGRFVLLAVSDTGQGMSEEVKQHVFEPFFTTKSMGRGTGLGLATIFGIIKQAGGAIDFYSVEDRGTTFKIYIPRVEDEPDKAISTQEEELATGNETVLLVEDDQGVRVPAVMALEHLGYNVLSAPTWTEVFSLAKQYKSSIDLLLTDVVMPGINGRELADRLLAFHPEMKVLFTSGYTENIIVEHGVLESNINFIGKPYSVTAMSRKIRKVLDGHA